MLVAKPFGSFGTALSCILFFANLVIFAVAFWRGKYELRQRREVQALQKQTRDLASQLEDFQGKVMGIVAVERTIGKADRRRFLPGGDWCATASTADVMKAAADIELDLVGMQDKEDELRRFLEVAAQQEAKGEVADWYWKEDDARMAAHDPTSTFGMNWVKYADSVAAQMEFCKSSMGATDGAPTFSFLLLKVIL